MLSIWVVLEFVIRHFLLLLVMVVIVLCSNVRQASVRWECRVTPFGLIGFEVHKSERLVLVVILTFASHVDVKHRIQCGVKGKELSD